MKNIIKTTILLFLVSAIFTSCDNKLTDADYLDGRTPYIEFQKDSDIFFIKMDIVNTYEVKIKLTEPAQKSFTYVVEINAGSDAIENTDYTLANNSSTVNSGDQFITFDVIGDFDNASVDGKTLIFDLMPTNGLELGQKTSFELTLLKFCPIETSFTGMYTLTNISGGLGGFFGQTPIFGDGIQVEIVAGASDTERIFSASYYPALLSSPAQEVSFSLVCGKTIMNDNVSTISCDSGVTPLAVSASTTVNAGYNTNDDTTFNIIFTENPTEGCDEVPVISEIQFTKI